ncbi:hypothetical protein BJY01DRAFT_234494 [Aspergillus pseudoustus]|uniref:Uncharacterized protein n=1 Tax=Aspergillus pseudoustus TaxID=1810923 RepID=A0ABR4K4M2_9EURO
MGYQYSDKLDPMLYDTHSLDGGIPLRVHVDPENRETAGSLAAQIDGNRCVRPMFSFISICVPECLPEALEDVSYANEFAFLYDGERLIDSKTKWDDKVRDTQQAEMAAIDRSRAMTMANPRFRICFGTLTFAMVLTIPIVELELLTNNLYSWDKERVEAKSAGRDSVYNAIWAVMQEQVISEKEAKQVCIAKIKHYIGRCCHIVKEAKRRDWLSDDLKTYLDSIHCRRRHGK